VEEVDRQDRGGLCPEELPPGPVVLALRGGWDTGVAQNPADARRADAMAEFAQFALDPSVAPGRVFPGEPLDQRDELLGGLGIGPPQHRDLVAQHEKLDVFGRRRAGQQDQPVDDASRQQVQQS
jgi:hypothetical protein